MGMKKETTTRRWKTGWKPALAIAMVVVGLGIAYYGNTLANPIVIALGTFLLLGGIILLLRAREELGARILKGKKLKHPANALIIYPGDIEFDYVKKPPAGYQQRCVNDGRWYSVLLQRPGEKLQEYLLPDDKEDARYYDPAEFSNPVTMTANKKLFTPRPSMAKTIAVGLMAAAVIVGFIVIIAMSG